MNVASLEPCKELYELSGWDDTTHYWHSLISHDMKRWSEYKLQDYKPDSDFGMKVVPAYDLGYLLRKLKSGVNRALDDIDLSIYDDKWAAGHKALGPRTQFVEVNPEDAVAELVIELFKQGTLTKPNLKGREKT